MGSSMAAWNGVYTWMQKSKQWICTPKTEDLTQVIAVSVGKDRSSNMRFWCTQGKDRTTPPHYVLVRLNDTRDVEALVHHLTRHSCLNAAQRGKNGRVSVHPYPLILSHCMPLSFIFIFSILIAINTNNSNDHHNNNNNRVIFYVIIIIHIIIFFIII
jgi:hypothetical protein